MTGKGINVGKMLSKERMTELVNQTNLTKWVYDPGNAKVVLYIWNGLAWIDSGVFYEL